MELIFKYSFSVSLPVSVNSYSIIQFFTYHRQGRREVHIASEIELNFREEGKHKPLSMHTGSFENNKTFREFLRIFLKTKGFFAKAYKNF